MANDNMLRRLETQLEVIPVLLAGAGEESIVTRPVSGQWSARENLAHLARYHAVFLERLHRILEENSPNLGRYRAEEDPAWPEWSSLSLEEILARLRVLRPEIVGLVRGLSDEESSRTGVHPLLGEMSLSRWMEFFLLHEAHHLYIVMLRLGAIKAPAGVLKPRESSTRGGEFRVLTTHGKSTGSAVTLFELIQRLDEFDDGDPSRPLTIYAQHGADAGRRSPALVCPRSEQDSLTCPLDPTLSEVLSVRQAREALEVWSAWRGGLTPSPEDRFKTVMFFSQYGTFFPLESDQEGM